MGDRTGERAQQGKELAAKLDDLSSMSWSYLLGENGLFQVVN